MRNDLNTLEEYLETCVSREDLLLLPLEELSIKMAGAPPELIQKLKLKVTDEVMVPSKSCWRTPSPLELTQDTSISTLLSRIQCDSEIQLKLLSQIAAQVSTTCQGLVIVCFSLGEDRLAHWLSEFSDADIKRIYCLRVLDRDELRMALDHLLKDFLLKGIRVRAIFVHESVLTICSMNQLLFGEKRSLVPIERWFAQFSRVHSVFTVLLTCKLQYLSDVPTLVIDSEHRITRARS